jgi:hypothetical protein
LTDFMGLAHTMHSGVRTACPGLARHVPTATPRTFGAPTWEQTHRPRLSSHPTKDRDKDVDGEADGDGMMGKLV